MASSSSRKVKDGSPESRKKTEAESQARISLFDASYGTIKERILLQRLIVIAHLPQQLADRADLGAHYEKLQLHLQKRYRWDFITGLLLIYPSCMLHIIESSSEVLVSVLKDLKDMQEQPESTLLEAPKVMFMAHNPPGRLFQKWSYKVLKLQTTTIGDESEEESTETLVCTVLSALRKLSERSEISKALPGSVLDEAPELIVPQNVLDQLLSRGELQSPQQYLQTYHSPLNIVMDSGHVFGSSCPTTV
ncbi:testis-expressed protein 47 [Myripristis murdjan]|uniref:testis-expressed protein 47 n=1 Tax=Myripristis murdjan TaxID=586833 RepID=UPI00117618C6|nr:testis-expressed protein 47 [Myripristis murdjan]